MKLIIEQSDWSVYRRFVSLCCVSTLPQPAGKCWIGRLMNDNEDVIIEPEVAFIGYNYPFRHNHYRQIALPELQKMNPRRALCYTNRHVRTLSRVMVKPGFRGSGIALCMVQYTLPLVGVRYIECNTFTSKIAGILKKSGFVWFGRAASDTCDYYCFDSVTASGQRAAIALPPSELSRIPTVQAVAKSNTPCEVVSSSKM